MNRMRFDNKNENIRIRDKTTEKEKPKKESKKESKKLREKKILVLDTSFLLLMGLNKLDIFSLIEHAKEDITNLSLTTTDGVLRELNRLSKGNSRKSRAAKLSLEIIKQKNLKILKAPMENVDAGLVALKPYAIATIDKELIRQALKNKIMVITLHNNKIIVRL